MRKLAILISFFAGAPLLIFASFVYLSFLKYQKTTPQVLGDSTQGVAYAALAPSDNVIETSVVEKDSKQEIIRQFFARHNSPLEDYAGDIIAAATRYDIDYRLLPAIAMQESTLCKRIITDSHNCWGWGIHGTKVTKFNNFSEAIETITKSLATKYRDQRGLTTPEEIAKLYNPSNTNNWVENVTSFMDQLK